MKKIGVCLIVTGFMFFLFGVGIGTPKAQEAMEESAQAQSSEGNQKVMLPVDSSKVIPPGPQWLGAPIMPGGRKVSEESGLYVTEYDKPYNEVLAWYQEALKRYPDARYRDWKEEMYIEDQGGSKWHAIKISKTGGPKTIVTIRKDNWTWILATLVIRFTGVFVVLLVLWIGLNVAAFIVLRFVKEEEKKPVPAASG